MPVLSASSEFTVSIERWVGIMEDRLMRASGCVGRPHVIGLNLAVQVGASLQWNHPLKSSQYSPFRPTTGTVVRRFGLIHRTSAKLFPSSIQIMSSTSLAI